MGYADIKDWGGIYPILGYPNDHTSKDVRSRGDVGLHFSMHLQALKYDAAFNTET